MICKNCGKEIEDGEKFCQECGTPTTEETTQETVSNTVDLSETTEEVKSEENLNETNPEDSSPILNSTSDYSTYSVPQDNPYAIPDPTAVPKKKKKGMKIALIVIAIILVILLISASVVGVVFFRIYKNMKVLNSTWDNVMIGDCDAIVENLPDEYLEKINEIYGYDEETIKSALEMLVTDMIATDIDSSSVSISSLTINSVKSADTEDQIVDTINDIFEDSLSGYESEFPTVFAGTYDIIQGADKVYTADEEITDGSETKEYVTILYKIDDTTYDAIPVVLTDICCYYYSIFESYYTTDVDESSTDAVAE